MWPKTGRYKTGLVSNTKIEASIRATKPKPWQSHLTSDTVEIFIQNEKAGLVPMQSRFRSRHKAGFGAAGVGTAQSWFWSRHKASFTYIFFMYISYIYIYIYIYYIYKRIYITKRHISRIYIHIYLYTHNQSLELDTKHVLYWPVLEQIQFCSFDRRCKTCLDTKQVLYQGRFCNLTQHKAG